MWRDWVEVLRLGPVPATIIVCNSVGITKRGLIHHWVTLHPEHMEGWLDARLAHGLQHPSEATFWCPSACDPVDVPGVKWEQIEHDPDGIGSGSTGLFAVRVAKSRGMGRIVLAGIPMDHSARWDRSDPWLERDAFVGAWDRSLDSLRGSVVSMSGWTREKLGAPVSEWWCHD